MTDPIKEIQERAMLISNRYDYGDFPFMKTDPIGLLLEDIQKLLKLVKAYEQEMKDQGNIFDFIDYESIKKEILKDNK